MLLCPKQGMYFRNFCLNRVRVLNPQRLTYTQILVGYSPPPRTTIQKYIQWSRKEQRTGLVTHGL